jgi:hypothetical protein
VIDIKLLGFQVGLFDKVGTMIFSQELIPFKNDSSDMGLFFCSKAPGLVISSPPYP